VERKRRFGSDRRNLARSDPPPDGQSAHAFGRHSRQPVGENDLKRGAPEQASIGYDANKKIKGRKRHLAVDTLGLVWGLEVTAASTQDRDGAFPVLAQLESQSDRLVRLYADNIYRGFLVEFVSYVSDWVLEIVEKPAGQIGFAVHPKRWVVERTFAWLVKFRRLVRDYEYLLETSKAMIKWAMVSHMIHRLAKLQAEN
jgi:transposase